MKFRIKSDIPQYFLKGYAGTIQDFTVNEQHPNYFVLNCKGKEYFFYKEWLEPVEEETNFEIGHSGGYKKEVSLEKVDVVNKPSHYQFGKYEPVKVIQDWDLSFCLGNVVKYIARAGRKDSSKLIEDLKKAKRYLELELENLEREKDV